MPARARLRLQASAFEDGDAGSNGISAATVLKAIGDPKLAERGEALVVSLAAIKAALGSRWPPRRNQVCEVVARYFRRYLTPTDSCQPVGESHFLVVTPGRTPRQAQAVCYRAIKDVMTSFLGEPSPQAIDVSRITSLSLDRVEIRPFTTDELERADLEIAAAPPQAASSSLSNLTTWPLTTADGQNLRVSFAVEPVLDLKAWTQAGHRIESRIMNLRTGRELTGQERRMLLPRDFEKIDLAALDRGISRLRGEEGVPDKALIIQLSFASLSNGRARAALLDHARELQGNLGKAAICELVDVEAGVPTGRLIDVISLFRSFFHGIFMQVEAKPNAIDSALAAGVAGLTVRAADLGRDEAAISSGVRDFVAMMKHRKTGLTATSLPTPGLMMSAMEAGFTHASLRVAPAG